MEFPLFKVPIEPGYLEPRTCTVCRREAQLSLPLGCADHLVVTCRRCQAPLGLGVTWETQCKRCGEFNLWPADFALEEAAVCCDCLREGRAAISHESELGWIQWPDAIRGLVEWGSEKVARREGLEIWVDDEWGDPVTYVRAPVAAMLELLRTPRHSSIQSEHWPFCCGGFCAYLGNWTQEDFERKSPGRGREWFERYVDQGLGESWDWLGGTVVEAHVYGCPRCDNFRIFMDTD